MVKKKKLYLEILVGPMTVDKDGNETRANSEDPQVVDHYDVFCLLRDAETHEVLCEICDLSVDSIEIAITRVKSIRDEYEPYFDVVVEFINC